MSHLDYFSNYRNYYFCIFLKIIFSSRIMYLKYNFNINIRLINPSFYFNKRKNIYEVDKNQIKGVLGASWFEEVE